MKRGPRIHHSCPRIINDSSGGEKTLPALGGAGPNGKSLPLLKCKRCLIRSRYGGQLISSHTTSESIYLFLFILPVSKLLFEEFSRAFQENGDLTVRHY
jgi:hypothetical protein